MSVTTVEWLANFGVAGIVVILMVTGLVVPGFIYKDLERANEKLSDALALERQRNADLQQVTATSTKALNAIAEVAQENRQREGPRPPHRSRRVDTPPAGFAVAGRE